MNTRRATSCISRQLGLGGERPHSRASPPVCQDGRVLAASFPVFPAGAFSVLGAGTVEEATSAIMVAGIVFIVLIAIIWRRGCANARFAKRNSELAAALNRSERNARESEATLKKQIERLKHEIANLLDVPPEEPLRKVGAKVRLAVPPDGSEVFLPLLDPRRVYQIVIHGICQFSESKGWFSRRDANADALYRTDEIGNFLQNHDCLKLAGVPVRRFLKGVPPETAPEEHRNAHRYIFRIDGAPKKISARYCVATEGLLGVPKGNLTITVEPLPEGTPSPASGERREEMEREKAKEAERVAQDGARRAEQAAKENSALCAKLASLQRQARFESHFLDPEFQRDFAKRDPAEILKTRGPKWREEYGQFMDDAPLKNLAEAQTPKLIEWFEARVEIVQLAERFAAAPRQTAEKKKPKLKAEEVRQMIVRRGAIQADDIIARGKLKGEKIARAKAELDPLPLDEDEKEQLKAEVIRKIWEEGEEHGHGKVGDTV